MLKPIGAAGVKAALVPLMLTQQLENLDNLPEGFDPTVYLHQKSAEYERHLENFPLDILRSACDTHARLSKFFPAVAEIVALAEPLLSARQRQQSRVLHLIKIGGQPVAEPPKRLTPEEQAQQRIDRLRQTRDTWRNLGRPDRAANAERELAKTEGREPEEWAVFAAPSASTVVPAPVARSRDDDALSRVKVPPIAASSPPHDEPPMPDEILESQF